MKKGRRRRAIKTGIIIALVMLLLSPLSLMRLYYPAGYTEAYAASDESGKLIIDPESISGMDNKEGNMLLEYEYAVFTNESMAKMQESREGKEREMQRIVDNLFSGEWNEIENYDAEVTEIIKAADLFSYIGTVTEARDAAYTDSAKIKKYLPVILTTMLTVIISAVCIGYIRKRNEYKRNNRAG